MTYVTLTINVPPEFTIRRKPKQNSHWGGGRINRPQRLWRSRSHNCGRCPAMTGMWGIECGSSGREGSRGRGQSWWSSASWGLGQFNGPGDVEVSWLEAVNGDSLQSAAHVNHKMFVPRLQNSEWALVGRAERSPVGVVANENVVSRPKPSRDVRLREAVTGSGDRHEKPCIVQ